MRGDDAKELIPGTARFGALLLALPVLASAWMYSRPVAADPAEGLSIDQAVDSIVRTEALSRDVPAVGVAIVTDGRIAVQRAYGWADQEARRAATAATPFNIASVTKPLTSAVALALVAEERIALDDPVSRHLDLPPQYRTITVRQLLSHTSGIARDLRLDNLDDPDRDTYSTRLDTASASSRPGERFEYSNTGYTVLGWLIEAVESRPLDEVFRDRIFEPLGMTQARYRASLDDDPLRARPHRPGPEGVEPTEYVTGGFASGGASMSTADAAAFALGLQDGTLLPPNAARLAWTPARLANGTIVATTMFGEPASYGFGWHLARYGGHAMFTHGGGIEGYSANLYHFPDESLTIFVLSNTKARDDGIAPVDPLARRLADFCLARNGCRPEPGAAELREEIVGANRAFSRAYVKGDTAAIRQMYAEGAIAMPPHGAAVTGAEAISRLFATSRPDRRLHHALYTERLLDRGSTVLELGSWYDRWRFADGTGSRAATGRYVLSWVREEGSWRLGADAWVPAE